MSTRATMSSIQFSQRFTGTFLYLALLFYLITSGHGSPLSIETRSKEFDLGLTELGSSFTDIKSDLTERSASNSNGSFPTAFDTLGNNFTATSCPQFFSDFLHNETYQSCRAVSILLQNSNTFFKDLGSPVTLDQVLDMSCSANITACSKFMANLAANLTSSNNCGADYQLGNPTVTQAYAGMLSYEPIAKAACLQDPSTGEFCFTEAATNSTNISGYSLYLLPLGNSLPGGSRPECNQCTQAIMTVFAESAVIKGSPLSQSYIPAAQTVNIGCGPNFVNATVKAGSENPSSGSSKSSGARLSRPLYTILGLSITTSILFMSMP